RRPCARSRDAHQAGASENLDASEAEGGGGANLGGRSVSRGPWLTEWEWSFRRTGFLVAAIVAIRARVDQRGRAGEDREAEDAVDEPGHAASSSFSRNGAEMSSPQKGQLLKRMPLG